MQDFQNVRFARHEQWIKIHFPIALKVIDKQQKTSGKGKTSNNKANKAKTKNGAYDMLDLNLFLTRSFAETLIGASPAAQKQAIVNLDDPWTRHMYNTALGARRSLEFVIEDLRFSVASCTRLEAGQIIPLPGASHERLKVKTRSADGNIVLAGATLGAFKANKAVKLNEDINPSFKGGLEIIPHNK